MRSKISPLDFSNFCVRYYRVYKFSGERVGQAFLNHVLMDVTDPTLFYEENDKRAMTKILDRYVKSEYSGEANES